MLYKDAEKQNIWFQVFISL